MKIEVNGANVTIAMTLLGMIVTATWLITITFATKKELEGHEGEYRDHIYYHMNQNHGAPPVFSGPIAPVEEEG